MGSEHEDEHWALKLLQEQSTWRPSILREHGEILTGGILGFFSAVAVNMSKSRPVHAGFQRHIAYTVIGGSLGYGVKLFLDDIHARRDAVMIDYIRRHPERFPEPERKRYADMFIPWVPKR